jgi:hypothetical protein
MLFNDQKTSISVKNIIINKTPFLFKFNNYNSYFFLTNYFMLITNYSFFLCFDNKKIIFKKYNYNQLILRNKYFFFKNILKFKKYIRLSLNLNNFKFKFNTFFKFVFFFNFIKNKIKNKNFFFNNFFYFNNIKLKSRFFKRFYKNWEKLIGNLISPYSLLLFSRKNWIRTNKNFNFSINKYLNKNKNKRKFFLFSKKHIINNFFYLNKSSRLQNYSNKSFLIKKNINYRVWKKNNYDFFFQDLMFF